MPADQEVWLQSENGMLGIGPFPTEGRGGRRPHQRRQADRDHPGGSRIFGSRRQLAMIRGGKINLSILGAMQVSERRRPGQLDDPGQDGQGHGRRHGPGGRRQARHRADGACGPKKDGTEDLKDPAQCTLPLTGVGVVDRIITDLSQSQRHPRWRRICCW